LTVHRPGATIAGAGQSFRNPPTAIRGFPCAVIANARSLVGRGLRAYREAPLSAWERGHRRGVVALPTGSGKTRLALAAMPRDATEHSVSSADTVLLDQWLREIGALYWGAVGYGDGVRRWHP